MAEALTTNTNTNTNTNNYGGRTHYNDNYLLMAITM